MTIDPALDVDHHPQTNELPTKHMHPEMDTLLQKSVALQLKLLLKDSNIQLNTNTFDELFLLVKYQMNDMARQLNQIMSLQRRSVVSLDDLEMMLNGYHLNTGDLFENIEVNKFLLGERLTDATVNESLYGDDNSNLSTRYKNRNSGTEHDDSSSMSHVDKILREQLLINKNLNLTVSQQDGIQNNVNNNHNNSQTNNPIFNCNIKLPDLPPDHTYKFTSQFNNFITDERIIKQNLRTESRITESTLLKYLNKIESEEGDQEESNHEPTHPKHKNVDDREMLALFGPNMHPKSYIHHDFNFYYNKKSFNIEEYSHHRINLARNKVKNFEINHIMNTKNPIFNYIRDLNTNKRKKLNEFDDQEDTSNNISLSNGIIIKPTFNNKRINTILQQDLRNFLQSRSHLQKKKKHVIDKAIKERDIRIQQIRQQIAEREKLEKERIAQAFLKNQQLANAGLLPDGTGNIATPVTTTPSLPAEIIVGTGGDDDDDMGLFGGLDSSDDETSTTTTVPVVNINESQNTPGTSNKPSVIIPISSDIKTIGTSTNNNISSISPPSVLPPSEVTNISISNDHTMTQPPMLIPQLNVTEESINDDTTSANVDKSIPIPPEKTDVPQIPNTESSETQSISDADKLESDIAQNPVESAESIESTESPN